MFVRFQSPLPTPSGRYPGLFALANQLADEGRLSAEDRTWWRENNDWFNDAYVEPGSVDPTIFDRELHPITCCWFKERTAEHLLARVPGYLRLLDKYEVPWVELRSDDPGTVVYEDDVQVVVWLHD
ncbi:MAG: hypothetical protein ABIR32_19565 [Ilumatobacteraceae bacterium]